MPIIITTAPSVTRNCIGGREVTDVGEMMARYAEIRARTWAPRPVPAPAQPSPEIRDLAKAQAERLAREAFEHREALDALVFQHLDPVKLAREPKRIIAQVAAEHGRTVADILGVSRLRVIVEARHDAIAAVHVAHPKMSLPRLGRIFGRDHTTILHVLRRKGLLATPAKAGDH